MYDNANKVYVETLKKAQEKNKVQPVVRSGGLLSRSFVEEEESTTMEPLDIVVDYVNMIKQVKSSKEI